MYSSLYRLLLLHIFLTSTIDHLRFLSHVAPIFLPFLPDIQYFYGRNMGATWEGKGREYGVSAMEEHGWSWEK